MMMLFGVLIVVSLESNNDLKREKNYFLFFAHLSFFCLELSFFPV